MIVSGDCFDEIKKLEGNSIDLVITSPPYADIVNYGKNISIKKADDYVDWILPLFKEINRVLKPSGSFILNINDKCIGGYRSTFIYDLISRNNHIKLYDTYIWHKKNGIPNGGIRRFRNNTEFIFHFVKDKKYLKFYMDRVLQEPKETSNNRTKYYLTDQGETIDGKRIKTDKDIKIDKVRPDNVFRFNTAGSSRDNLIKHPAPFNKELPTYFINFLTDENDLVLDPFAGIGTTNLAAQELNRDHIGFELNSDYADFANKRINGEDYINEYVINKYDLDGNFIKSYENASQAHKDNPSCYSIHDIMRCYDRVGFNTCGGYKWKKEKN